MKYGLLLIGIILSIILSAQDGSSLFQQKCSACHSIGKGRLVGPDLKDITVSKEQNWLISFIRSSQTMIQSGDAEAIAISKE